VNDNQYMCQRVLESTTSRMIPSRTIEDIYLKKKTGRKVDFPKISK
jgi:hypothetical protein